MKKQRVSDTVYEPICQVEGCPTRARSFTGDRDAWHRCFVCGKQPIQHQHWPKLSQAGKSSRIVAALCPTHHDRIDNGLWTNGVHQQGGKWYYWVLNEKGQTVQLWTPEGRVGQREIADPQFPGNIPVKRIPAILTEAEAPALARVWDNESDAVFDEPPSDEPREAEENVQQNVQEFPIGARYPAVQENVLPVVQYEATCLRLPEGMSFKDWLELGGTLQTMGKGLQWWLGDWLTYGEQRYGEKYSQAIEETGIDKGRLANYAWVSSNVDPSLRNENLSWSVHLKVADLEPKEQREWLQRASEDNLPANTLRAMIKGEEPDVCPESATGRHEWVRRCRKCGKER